MPASPLTSPESPAPAAPRDPLKKKQLTADHPTWCPGCGDFAVLASFFRVLEKLQYPHEKIVTLAGIGCSSRFPYFVNTYGGHYIHGRSIPFATGVSLGREDLHVVVFGGDGDGFSIGGNHLDHAARKNLRLTYVIMDNFVYGLTKKQTSPTSPLGFKSKTDPTGAIDPPVNPMRKLLASGATFVARTHAAQVAHMSAMIERALQHDGFSVVEVLSDCVEFFDDAFDAVIPRKGGKFTLIDDAAHDRTNSDAAFALASLEWPGVFGVFYEVQKPTKNAREAEIIAAARSRTKGADDLTLLQATLDRMK
jgi:2-oxoglutarate ferredoxin oxidoreductase subunit beta